MAVTEWLRQDDHDVEGFLFTQITMALELQQEADALHYLQGVPLFLCLQICHGP